ncbi:expressed unknown protein [Seminavis robusta]|uniref:PDZ domain-containing protein n=1 Tax=Seminavis robusta TaxID=568900 RepID=A0A9N8DDW9_9STRA|nr:expressed unknown protein [Seminavis robusta]|eukprot:Sro94_g048860.1 n/a (255) ;mRNA; f:23180-23944
MTTTRIITATKANASQKLGLKLNHQHNGAYLVKAIEAGILHGSGLQPGQEVLAINGTAVKGLDADTVLTLLTSAVGQITIQVMEQQPASPPVQRSCGIHCALGKTLAQMGSEQYRSVPRMLQDAGVSEQKWKRVLDAFAKDLVPALNDALAMDAVFYSEMERYVGAQMEKGYIGWGQESQHERKVYMMTQQSAIQRDNVAMVANNVLAKANALLNMHGIMAQLDFKKRSLPQFSRKQQVLNMALIPYGITFTQI